VKITPTSFVTIEFLIRLEGQQLVPVSGQPQRLSFCLGQGVLPPDLEETMLGLSINDSRVVRLTAAQAFGEIHPELIQNVPLSDFEPAEELETGMVFEDEDDEGHTFSFVIKEVKDDIVVIDFNHPLAGRDLEVAFTVREVREATQADLEQYICPTCQQGKPHQH